MRDNLSIIRRQEFHYATACRGRSGQTKFTFGGLVSVDPTLGGIKIFYVWAPRFCFHIKQKSFAFFATARLILRFAELPVSVGALYAWIALRKIKGC